MGDGSRVRGMVKMRDLCHSCDYCHLVNAFPFGQDAYLSLCVYKTFVQNLDDCYLFHTLLSYVQRGFS